MLAVKALAVIVGCVVITLIIQFFLFTSGPPSLPAAAPPVPRRDSEPFLPGDKP